MGGRIPENIVELITNESDIVAVISEYISLKKSGRDFKGLCPFHQEKTPSFYVVPSKRFFHCFGCGKGGSVVNFIMEQERMDYPSALRFLAEKNGIEIPTVDGADSLEEKLYDALSVAASFYQKTLYEEPAGKMALQYLKSRGITEKTARTFGFGYARPGSDNLIRYAASRGIKAIDLETAGLISKKDKYYDRFRNRLMIPIKTLSGKVAGFGGRAMSAEDSAKYINSPETPVYKKGRLLYGLDVSREDIRRADEAVVVEGYFDLVALHQAGIRNVVAVSGTGFSSQQASLLARFCQKVVLLYDSDSAGVKAANRACGVLYEAGLQPSLVKLPKGHDPDSFVRETGRDGLAKMISESEDIIDFVMRGLNGPFSAQTLNVQKRTVGFLSGLMAPIEDNLTRELLARKMFDRLDIDIKTLGVIGETKTPNDQPVALDDRPASGRDRFERRFLEILLANPHYLTRCGGVVEISLFSDETNARIYDALEKISGAEREISILELAGEIGNGKTGGRLREIAIRSEETGECEDEFEDSLRNFRRISARRRLDELKRLIGEAEKSSDHDKLESLTREFQNLKSEVKANDARV